ncbi:MAG TPA: class I SAM-dependent methyltransferase [Sandaracinaceae bacterium LLY-WYZ-13_1]|nr:class I SAM-dependent methyltransferase [Sandaracinaceae bacterium LLY-WYZ-13_1]
MNGSGADLEPPAFDRASGRWRGWANAEQYERFVREHRVYDWLNASLTARADLPHARRVLDLGCGTGATTRAVLGKLSPDAEVVGVDGSPEMVEVARANTLDPRARFVVSPAHRIGAALDGRFDRALCNAAFWQFDRLDEVLAGLAAHLEPGAPFLYNVPCERRPGEGVSHAFQIALAKAIEARIGEPYRSTASRFDPDRAAALAARHGLVEERREERVYRGRQGELMELMSIPAMLAPLAPELTPESAYGALREARASSDPQEPIEVHWLFVRYRRS